VMYSDRVDSVTRATNPSLLPSLPSTLLALLVRRPPPPPTRHHPMHRRTNHRLAVKPSSPFAIPLSFSHFPLLFFSSPTLVVFRCPSRTLASLLTHSPRLGRFFSFLSLFADTFSVSLALFHHLTLSLFASYLVSSFFLLFCCSISRYVTSSLT